MNVDSNIPAVPAAQLYPPPNYQRASANGQGAQRNRISYDTRIRIEEVPPPVSPATGRPADSASRGSWIAQRMAGVAMMAGGATMIYKGAQKFMSAGTADPAQGQRSADACHYSARAGCGLAVDSPAAYGLVVGGAVATLAGLVVAIPQSRRLVACCGELITHC